MRLGSNIQPPLGTPINKSHPLAQGLVGCWLLNEFGGKVAINSADHTIMNGALESAMIYKMSPNGVALYSDATTDNTVNCGQSSQTQLSTPLSISAWISSTSSATGKYIMSHANFRTDLFGFEFFMDLGKIYFYIDGSAGTSTLSTSGTYNDGKWHHVMGVADGTNQFIYVDGRQAATGSQTQTPSYSTLYNLYIGNSWDSQVTAGPKHPWDGYINNVMLWNRAITSTEVAQLYASPYSMFNRYGKYQKITGQLQHYKFNNSGIRPRPFAPGIAR